MAQVVNTNVPALFSQRQLNKTNSMLETSLQRLSSGLRINSAKDDAAGLAIGTRFQAQIKGMDVAMRNANDGVSMTQTAEAGLDEITTSLQRLRELAVQASNGTLTGQDRESLNMEAQQLIAEIGSISESTQFNGIKLLDGTAQDVTLQVGANAGQTMNFDIDGARTDQLGVMQSTSLSSSYVRGDVDNETAMQQGDLIINGVEIGGSVASYDTASSTRAAASAISKAAAINEKSAETGVTAQLNTTLVEGAAMTAGGVATTSGEVTVNGVTITVTMADQDAAATRTSVVNAINERSGVTGVTAHDTGDDATGVQLQAEDGRNVSVTFTNGITSAGTGILGGDITYGTFTLTSDKTITLEEGLGGKLDRTGLTEGDFEKGVAYLSSSANNGTAIASADFTINGTLIGPSVATSDALSSTGNSSSAIAKAAAINKISEQTGVTATVDANLARGTGMTGASENGFMAINGVTTATIATTADEAQNRIVVAHAINQISARTGIQAVNTGDDATGVELVAQDGRNVKASSDGTLTAASTGVTFATTYGGFTLESSKAITIGAGTTGMEEHAGLTLGTFGHGEGGTALKDLDLTTAEGAQAAISSIDNALDSVSDSRSNLGALQNRINSTVSRLQSASESFSAARSRIMDADFAAETAQMTKAQVLQQAGVAMLAQAKALPQQVMSLLQG